MSPDARLKHFFSVDVEEYFQVSAFEEVVPRATWERIPSRLHVGLDRILDLLGRNETVGTFFVLGWVARRHPELVRRIADQGHELASHGWSHRRVTDLPPDAFREEVRASRALLEDLGGRRVRGYRAPSFSIVPGTEWALDVLLEEGYEYDSSLFPIRRLGYGYPGGETVPHRIGRDGGVLLELPPATAEIGGLRVPAGGGAYFRLLPYGITRHALRALERRRQRGMFYIHPWELDPDQPRLGVSAPTRVRHYGALGRMEARLNRLLGEFRFTSVERALFAAPARPRSRAPTPVG